VVDHKDGEGGEGNVGAGEQGSQPAERKAERLHDENENVHGPLLKEEQGKTKPDAILGCPAETANGDSFNPSI